ncbi:MAG: hypothetical protein QOG68_1938 [Solirubrobacteraceae bacterium]|nr:hypothetical protein [Solirubrobacteraceae bacterium]
MSRDAQPSAWPRVLLAALSLAALIGFFVYPTYPNYDSLYSLIWGQEALHGHLPSFTVYRAPTEHPLAIVFGAVMSLFGTGGDRLLVGATLASFVGLVAGVYRLGAATFTPLVGVVAGILVCTRFDFAFLAARGYIDIPYLAFVVWAAALEAQRRRRGRPVFVLLTLAALMRPEAWLLVGLYWLWYAWPRTTTTSTRVKTAALAATGPVIWALVDLAVTGDPLYSLHSTSTLADELGRANGLSAVPHATWAFLTAMDKTPVVLVAIAGLAIAVALFPRRAVGMPALLLAIGLATFGLVGVAGLSIINRYLLVPGLMILIFAGVALGGWTMLSDGLVRRIWAGLFAVALVGGGVLFAINFNPVRFQNELDFRGRYRGDLIRLLDNPAVKAGLKCGPLSTPNHKLIPDVRWVTGLGADRVIARSDPSKRRRIHRGVALFVTQRYALLRQAFVSPLDDPRTELPLPGFTRVAGDGYYGAYVRCPGATS